MNIEDLGIKTIRTMPEIVQELSKDKYECPYCEAEFEEDDFAYLQETGKCQYCHEDLELCDYSNTPFRKRCDEMIEDISSLFKNIGFTDAYLKCSKQIISQEDFEKYVYNKLFELDEYKRHDFNEMWKMLSDTNCWYADYYIGCVVHKQLMKIWNPERY